MYGSLRGTVLRIDGSAVLMEAGGIGFEAEASAAALRMLQPGRPAFIYVHHIVREDAELLFGFASFKERLLFRELLKVSGVGPRLALSMVSALSAKELMAAVQEEDVRAISIVPGIGRKTAERLIVELKDRFKRLSLEESSALTDDDSLSDPAVMLSAPADQPAAAPEADKPADDAKSAPKETSSGRRGSKRSTAAEDQLAENLSPRAVRDEAISALMGLGYKEAQAVSYVKAVYQKGMDTKAVIVAALGHVNAINRRS